MSVTWVLPWAFAGLAALLVPVLLHLDRRRSVQSWRFAALRWIAAQARPRRTWRLIDVLLLLLRMLLVALLVAWLAQPLLRGFARAPAHWVAVVPGAALPGDVAQAVWIAPGFPTLAAVPQPPAATVASVSSLLREFDAQLPREDTFEVRVPEVVHWLDEAPIALSREVKWVVAGGAAPPAASVAPKPRILALRYGDDAASLLRPVRAALRAWEGTSLAVQVEEGALDAALPTDVDAVLWVGAEAAARADAEDTRQSSAVVGQLESARQLAPGFPPARERRSMALVASDVAPALLQSAEFPRWLHRELFGAPAAPDRAPAQAVAPTASVAPFEAPPLPLRPWFALLAAVVFLLERCVSTSRSPRKGAPQ